MTRKEQILKQKLLNKAVKTMQDFIEIQNELLLLEKELKNKEEEE